jgi:hypothetical protein
MEGALERRQHGFGKIVDRDAKAHGAELGGKLEAIVASHKQKPKIGDIDPALILKVQLSGNIPEETWAAMGMTLLADEADESLVLFANDAELQEFKRRVSEYQKGPPAGKKNPVYAGLIGAIASVSELVPGDRIGPVLRGENKNAGADFAVADVELLDIELWQPNQAAVLGFVARVERTLHDHGGILVNEYRGDSMTLVRARVGGDGIRALLELPEVFIIDRPPQPDLPLFDVSSFRVAQLGAVIPPGANAPIIGIIDSGVNSAHPLLAGLVAEVFSVPDALGDADDRGHGTPVSGIAIYGDVRQHVEQGEFAGHFRVASAKVVDSHGNFSDTGLVPTYMAAAIRRLHQIGCRVINLSLGDPKRMAGDKPTPWAALLDELARELDLIIVVSAGNRRDLIASYGDGVVAAYPNCLVDEKGRILEPATAVNVLTIGSVAHSNGIGGNDAEEAGVVPLTQSGYPSPFTRTGPGVGGIIKPDFVDFGGTAVFDGPTQSLQGGDHRAEAGVVSLNRNYLNRMLTAVSGTSFAAPLAAYKAALVREALPEASANQVRALLAISAEHPEAALKCLKDFDEDKILHVLGHGIIDAEKAAYSDDHRVVLVREDTLPVNRFAVYEVPVPQIFQQEKGTRRIRVALAFDPIVRHTRLDYAGLSMSFDLYRGATAEEVFNACRKWADAEGDAFKLIDSRRCKLTPSTRLRGSGTLQCGSFIAQRSLEGYGDSYFLTVRLEGGWASAISPEQRFAVAVELQHQAEIALYQQVQQRVQLPV